MREITFEKKKKKSVYNGFDTTTQ